MDKHNFNAPWYELYYRMYCSGIIYVNDVPVIMSFGKKTREGGLVGQIPINNILLESGKYTVRGMMLPRTGDVKLGEDNYMSIDFNLSDIYNSKETKLNFHAKIESPDSNFVHDNSPDTKHDNKLSNPIENLLQYELLAEIEVELPYKLDGWQNSIDLSRIKEADLFKQVLMHYKIIHNTMIHYNSSEFLKLSKEKDYIQTQSFYLNSIKRENIHNDIFNLFQEKLEVLPLNENELKIEVFGNGKLVSLSRLDKSPALQFISPDISKEGNIELAVKLHMRSKEIGFSII